MLRSPRWIVLHIVVGLLVVLFVLAGFWQLRRLDERRDQNALIRERRAMRVVDLETTRLTPNDLLHRRVRVDGAYNTAREFVLLGRGRGGRQGNHVLSPLIFDEDRAVYVDRGWVPPQLNDPPVDEVPPPSEEVSVEGVALPSEERPFGGGTSERIRVVSVIDIARMARGLPQDTLPFYVLLREQRPSQRGELPIPADLPEPTEGSHLSYAGQWFLFAAVSVIGYTALLRREVRKTTP